MPGIIYEYMSPIRITASRYNLPNTKPNKPFSLTSYIPFSRTAFSTDQVPHYPGHYWTPSLRTQCLKTL